MYRTQPIDSGVRGSAAILVIAAHVVVIYAIAVTLGVVPAPSLVPTMKAVIIPNTEPIPEPTPPVDEPVFQDRIVVPAPDPLPLPLPEPDRRSAMQVTQSSDSTGEVTPSQGGASPFIQKSSISVTRRVDPVYPPSAIRQELEGTVRVRILVDERGRARDVQVSKSSGYTQLDDAAVDAVRRWQFSPATENSRVISAWTEVSVIFRLDR